jgi:hypothetical protein
MKYYLITKKALFRTILVLAISFNYSCEVEPEIYSDVLPQDFFQTPEQLASAAATAYSPLVNYSNMAFHNSEIISDVGTVPVRSNGGWNDGGTWPKLMNPSSWSATQYPLNQTWEFMTQGVSTCNRLIEIFSQTPGSEVGVAELRSLRAFYFYKLLSAYGNITIESRFSNADSNPKQVTAQEAFDFIEKELLESIDLLSEEKGTANYGKVNKWVGYSILADLYLNSKRITDVEKWTEAAAAANVVIDEGGYALESGYFANFRAANEGSLENIWIVPYDETQFAGFEFKNHLHQSASASFGWNDAPWGGFTFQTEFYNSFEEDDLRKGMFIVGQQYTSKAGPVWNNTTGFGYASPSDEYKLENCSEDFDNYKAAGLESQLDGGCNIFITPDYTEIDKKYPYKNGARWGKFEMPAGENNRFINSDFPIYRLAGVQLTRAEALWREDNGSIEALNLVNQVRTRAGLDNLNTLTEEDLYNEFKKEMALEGFSRAITIRFDKWEDDWFLKGIGNQNGVPSTNAMDPTRRIFPIPQGALDANPNLIQNSGYN